MKKQTWRLALCGLPLLLACATAGSQVRPDISGNYDIAGTNEDGAAYQGKLQVLKHGSVYQFRWLAGNQYDGVGIINGNTVAVAYTDGANGTGCGVVSYRTLANGTLDGVWGLWGVDRSGTETAVRASGSSLNGSYNVTGTNPGGAAYRVTLAIAPQGAGYEFSWSNNSSGFGIKQGNTISVGFGGAQCAWVAYEIKAGGVLDGIWGSYGSTRTGTERAVKR
ncbi:MAG: hypothetical protein ABI698_01020 [bacterium]